MIERLPHPVISIPIVVFTLDDSRYGLPLGSVERAVRMVEITPLPKAPDVVVGVIDVQGRPIPVVSVRRRFGIAERHLAPEHQLIVATTHRRPVALIVDAVIGVYEYPADQLSPADEILPRLPYIEGVIRLDDGIVVIHDLNRFLSIDEVEALDRALEDV